MLLKLHSIEIVILKLTTEQADPLIFSRNADCQWICCSPNESSLQAIWDLSNCSTLSIEERHRYERSLKAYRDYINQVDYAMAEGEAKGETKERMKNAKRMKEEGIDINLIHKITDLSIEEIEKL